MNTTERAHDRHADRLAQRHELAKGVIGDIERATTETGDYRVFVYGSLMIGHGNYCVLRDSGADYESDATTAASDYRMQDMGAFPGVTRDGSDSIKGQTFIVKERGLAACHRLESHPRFYVATVTEIEYPNGDREHAIMYILNSNRTNPRVPDGDWNAHHPRRR